MGLSKKQEKAYAKELYVNQNLSQKEVAERVGVTEKTVGKWVRENESEWERLKKSLLMTNKSQLAMLYDQLDWLNTDIRSRENTNVATSKEADVIAKLTASINRLEHETSIGQVVEVARDFIDFVRPIDLELAKKITDLFDNFINHKMK